MKFKKVMWWTSIGMLVVIADVGILAGLVPNLISSTDGLLVGAGVAVLLIMVWAHVMPIVMIFAKEEDK